MTKNKKRRARTDFIHLEVSKTDRHTDALLRKQRSGCMSSTPRVRRPLRTTHTHSISSPACGEFPRGSPLFRFRFLTFFYCFTARRTFSLLLRSSIPALERRKGEIRFEKRQNSQLFETPAFALIRFFSERPSLFLRTKHSKAFTFQHPSLVVDFLVSCFPLHSVSLFSNRYDNDSLDAS